MGDEKSSLSVSDICDIIKACGQNGVRKFSYGEISLRLGQPVLPIEQYPHPAPRPTPESIAAFDRIQAKEAERAFVQDEVALKEEQLRLMLIEDPEGLEKLLNQMQTQGDGLNDERPSTEEEA